MFKSILKILKKVIISIIVLYGYNLLTQSFNLNIPINVITVLIIATLLVFNYFVWLS